MTMHMHGTLCPKSAVDKVHVSQHNGGRGLASAEMCARAKENNLAFYVKMSSEQFLCGVKLSNILDCVEAKEKKRNSK